jgi:hypothetical protein
MGMRGCVPIGRTIAAKRNPAFLAGAQMHPAIPYFYAFFAHIFLCVFQCFNGTEVFADIFFHGESILLFELTIREI